MGREGQGCHCCWFHMAQLAQAGSGVGCFMEIPCQFPFSEAQCASALTHSCQRGFQAKLHQTPQLLMGTHSLELIVGCFPLLLFSKTNYKTSMLCMSYKTPSRTSVTCSRARVLEGGCSNHNSPKYWSASQDLISSTGRQSLGFSINSSQMIGASLTKVHHVLLWI